VKKPFADSSEQLKERLRRIVKKPRLVLTAEIALLALVVLIAGLLLFSALQGPADEGTKQEPQLKYIMISQSPYRCKYICGEDLITDGLILRLVYTDGSSKTVTEGFSCSPTKLTAEGDHEITVKYADHITAFTVSVLKVLKSGTCGINLTWAVASDFSLIIEGSGYMADYKQSTPPWKGYAHVMKEVYLPEGLLRIGSYAFCGFINLKHVRIPDQVRQVGQGAFEECSKLESCVLSKGLTEVPEDMFYRCVALTRIHIPASVKQIGISAFWGCTGLGKCTFSSGIEQIGAYAFGHTGLKQIHIPETVKTIGEAAFVGCKLLEECSFVAGVQEIGQRAFEECTALPRIHLPDTVLTIGDNVFDRCTALTECILSEKLNMVSKEAFADCTALEYIRVPDSVQVIGESAFVGCSSLKEVSLPQGLQIIRGKAFMQCTNLKGIALPSSLVEIDAEAFRESGLQQLVIPEGVTTIPYCVFYGCNALTQVKLPSSITTLQMLAFDGCPALKTIHIPAGLKELDENMFDDGLIEYFTVDEDNPYFAADGCGVIYTKDFQKLVLYPSGRKGNYAVREGCTVIGKQAFAECPGLTGITLPSTLQQIEERAFWFCRGIKTINIPAGLSNLEYLMFQGNEIESFTVDPANPYFTTDAYGAVYTKDLQKLVLYPGGREGGYSVLEGCTEIGESALESSKYLTVLDIPASVQRINARAIYLCDVLTQIYVRNPQCQIGVLSPSNQQEVVYYGYQGSALEQYARQFGYHFVALQE